MHVDLDIAMGPTTASDLPYWRRRTRLHLCLRRLVGDPGTDRRARSEPGSPTRREVGPALARGAVRPHSGRGGAVIDLRDAPGDPLPERERMLVRPAREWQAHGRAAAVGLTTSGAGGRDRRRTSP